MVYPDPPSALHLTLLIVSTSTPPSFVSSLFQQPQNYYYEEASRLLKTVPNVVNEGFSSSCQSSEDSDECLGPQDDSLGAPTLEESTR